MADFIACQRTEHGVPHALTCRALGVSESWFYKWHDRAPTARQLRKAALCERVTKLFEASGKATARRGSTRTWSMRAGRCR
ncbi:hypothetical protein ABH926_009157 [Catenulispora sp. GP43]